MNQHHYCFYSGYYDSQRFVNMLIIQYVVFTACYADLKWTNSIHIASLEFHRGGEFHAMLIK